MNNYLVQPQDLSELLSRYAQVTVSANSTHLAMLAAFKYIGQQEHINWVNVKVDEIEAITANGERFKLTHDAIKQIP